MIFATVGVGDRCLRLAPACSRFPERTFGVMSNYVLLAVPYFIFMGTMLEKSKLAEDLLTTIGQVFGRVRGGLAFAVIFVGALSSPRRRASSAPPSSPWVSSRCR